MQRESNWRNWLTLVVTLLCLLFISPTLRYVVFVFRDPAPVKEAYQTSEEFEKATKDYDETRARLQRNAIKLGLDLIGGVDVLLQIDEDQMRGRVLEQKKEILLYRLRQEQIFANVDLTPDKRALSIDIEDTANAQRVGNILKSYVENEEFDPFDEAELARTGKAKLTLTDDLLRNEMSISIANAEKTIRNRVDEFGVTQPSVSLQPEDYSIRVQVPGEKDPEYVISQIIKPAQLAFYMLWEDPNGKISNEEMVDQIYEKVTVKDRYGKEVQTFRLREGAKLPLDDKRVPCVGMLGEESKRGRTGGPPQVTEKMYIVKRHPAMDGANLRDAGVQTNLSNLASPVVVRFEFNMEGAQTLRQVTKENKGKFMAIALDKKIYSAPVIKDVIPNGLGVIEGSFSHQEARDLSLVLKAGALPADLKPVEKRAVGATLGAESIRQSIKALVITALLVGGFMLAYYGTAGLISVAALALNLLAALACLDLFNATLTLSGIGGLILTIGMAVDANVLIYERIREEVNGGRELRTAIRAGFGRAFSVIWDSNLTTILGALVLLQFGEGSVQGFALTMTFGLIANLFTGLTVTYALCSLWFRWRGKLSLGYLYIFRHVNFDFIGARYASWSISGLALLASISVLIARGGPQMAVDFEGGVLANIRIVNAAPSEDKTAEIGKALTAAGISADQSRIQRVTGGEANDYLLRVPLVIPPGAAAGDVSQTQEQLSEKGLTPVFGKDGFQILSATGVNQEVGQSFQQIAFFVLIATSICILIYLWFRFELVFGAAAVVALVHDLTITLGAITALDVQISLDIVSAFLILLGFGVNDTIVIFDRIRENTHTMFGKPFKTICNSAMNTTLPRTIITTGTVFLAMAIMALYGGRSLQPFALTLVIGTLISTYSSDFIAAPMVFWWNQRRHGHLAEELGRKPTAPAIEGDMGVETAPASVASSPTTPQGAPRRQGRR